LLTVNYTNNFNGKLFCDVWGDVRLHDEEKFFPSNIIEVHYKNKTIGTAQVMAVRTFEFKQIRDALAFLDCGKPSYYLASLLQKFYGPLQPQDKLDHIVLKYTNRNIELQEQMIKDWWQHKIEQSPS